MHLFVQVTSACHCMKQNKIQPLSKGARNSSRSGFELNSAELMYHQVRWKNDHQCWGRDLEGVAQGLFEGTVLASSEGADNNKHSRILTWCLNFGSIPRRGSTHINTGFVTPPSLVPSMYHGHFPCG